LTDQFVLEVSFFAEPDHDFCRLKLGYTLLEELKEDMGTEVANSGRRDVLDFFRAFLLALHFNFDYYVHSFLFANMQIFRFLDQQMDRVITRLHLAHFLGGSCLFFTSSGFLFFFCHSF